jgi:hypothetical protein
MFDMYGYLINVEDDKRIQCHVTNTEDTDEWHLVLCLSGQSF